MVIGFRIGAASRKVSESETVRPRVIKVRANGTFPHSQTGNATPRRDNTARRRTGVRGRSRNIRWPGTHSCTAIDTVMPRMTNGSDSMTTLMASVRAS